MADVSVEVANAVVRDHVELESKAPPEFMAKAGRGVRLRYVYRFEEQSTAEEAWSFRFTVRVDGGEPMIKEASHGDRRGIYDHGVKNLHVDLDLPKGSHEVRCTAEASLEVTGGQDHVKRRKKVESKLVLNIV